MMQGFDIPPYVPENGIDYEWIGDSVICTSYAHNEIVISANRDGLLTLARFCLTLAQEGISTGEHIHFNIGSDWAEGLADGSISMVLQRIDGVPIPPPPTADSNV